MKQAILLLLLSAVCSAESNKVVISSMILPPYVDRYLPNKGIVPHIVQEVFATENHKVRIEFSDWMTVSGTATSKKSGFSAYMPESYPKIMSEKFDCSNSVLEVPMLLVGRSGESSIETLDDSKITIIGSVSEFPLDKIEASLRETYVGTLFHDIPTEMELIRGVLEGSIDFAYIDSLMYYNVIHIYANIKEKRDALVVTRILGYKPTYVCFNKYSTKMLELFNRALLNVNTRDILYKYIPDFENIVKQNSNKRY